MKKLKRNSTWVSLVINVFPTDMSSKFFPWIIRPLYHSSQFHASSWPIYPCMFENVCQKISLIFQRNFVHRSQIVKRIPVLTNFLRSMSCRGGECKGWCWPMRPKARALAQHGGPLGWMKESDPVILCDGRSMPPALTDHTTCPRVGLIYYWVYTKHRHELSHARKACPGTLVVPCLLSDANITLE
jgi:hypothetical protein